MAVLNLLAGLLSITILIGLVFFLRNLAGTRHNRRPRWFLGAYIAVLVLSAVIVYMIPTENFQYQQVVTPEELKKAEQASRELYDAAGEGRLNQVEGIYVNGQWSFEYAGDRLKIADVNHTPWVMAERKQSDDGVVEVVSYLTTTIMDNINFTNKVEPPEVFLEGNKLVINTADSYEIKVIRFNKDFTINQFSGDNIDKEKYSSHSVMGHQLLYLRIPKSLQLDSPNFDLQIIGEE